MRILQVLPTLGHGGVSRVVLNYYRELEPDGFVFDFVTHGGAEAFHAALVEQGSVIHYVPSIGQVGLCRYFRALKAIAPKMYDVVHIHTGHLTGAYALLFRLLGQKRLVLHAHTTVSVNPRHRVLAPVLKLLALMLGRVRLACGVEAGDFCFGRGRYRVLPNGLDFRDIEAVDLAQITRAQEEMGLPPGAIVVGLVGRFTAEKNHGFALDVLESSRRSGHDVRLVLVGEGPLRAEVQENASQRGLSDAVLFMGPRADVFVLMRCFDVLMLPSRFEGMPMVAIEAQASGTPCLLSDVIDRTVDLGLGLVKFLPPTSSDEWAEQIVRTSLLQDESTTSHAIFSRLSETGYEIRQSAALLGECYRSLSTREADA